MNSLPRKKSPRAPSMALDEALERAMRLYEKQNRHSSPIDLAAQGLGYSGAKNGAALAAIASLRYFGLLERPQEGRLAVAKDVETYRFAPTEEIKQSLLRKWVSTPAVFATLIEKYRGMGLPPDPNIRFELLERGFTPSSAESTTSVFRRSVEFARVFEDEDSTEEGEGLDGESGPIECETSESRIYDRKHEVQTEVQFPKPTEGADRIPVRLSGGRKAWLEIPAPFYEADKERLKKQIDLLLVDDDGASNDNDADGLI